MIFEAHMRLGAHMGLGAHRQLEDRNEQVIRTEQGDDGGWVSQQKIQWRG